MGRKVYDINCGSVSGFRAVPLEQEVLYFYKVKKYDFMGQQCILPINL